MLDANGASQTVTLAIIGGVVALAQTWIGFLVASIKNKQADNAAKTEETRNVITATHALTEVAANKAEVAASKAVETKDVVDRTHDIAVVTEKQTNSMNHDLRSEIDRLRILVEKESLNKDVEIAVLKNKIEMMTPAVIPHPPTAQP